MIYQEQQKGFTLIETFVAVTVLIFSIAGPLSLVSQSLFSSLRAKDQLVATYLAEAALEDIRNTRDQNALQNLPQDEGLTTCYAPAKCMLNITNGTVSLCNGGVCDPLEYQSSTGVYGYSGGNSGWETSKFTRYFSIESVQSAGSEMEVTATVEWQAGFLTKSVSLSDHLFTWQSSL